MNMNMNNNTFQVHGVVTAMVTPFTTDSSLDIESLSRLAAWQSEKVDALFPMGTSGEGLLMTVEERIQALEEIVEAVNGHIPVIAHVGAITTRESMQLASHAHAIGVSAVTAINPFYFRVSEEEQIEHLIMIAAAAEDTPFFLYNNPAAAGNSVTERVVKEVSERITNFAGIKDSSKSIPTLCQYRSLISEDKNLLVGGDRIFAQALPAGVQGAVSTISNIYPELFKGIYSAYVNNDEQSMQKKQQTVCDILDILTSYPYYSAIKLMLEYRGIDMPPTYSRMPIGRISSEQKNTLRNSLKEVKELEGLV